MEQKLDPLVEKIHNKACLKKENHYIDPETGFIVFTEYFLKERGYCCESSCRHCPYGYKK